MAREPEQGMCCCVVLCLLDVQDLSVVLGDVQIDGEEARLGSFFDQPWCHDAVFRYLNQQTMK